MRISKTGNLTLILLILTPLSYVSPQVITNEQVVIEAARMGVEGNFKSSKFTSIGIEVSESEISGPVASGLTEGFRNLGINVVGNGKADSAVQHIDCDILGFEFKYQSGDSRGFLRKRKIKRGFKAVLKLTLLSARDSSVSEIKDINISYEDQIDSKLADLVKSRNIPALDPPFPSSGFKKIAEPVIVTAAVGALIYLFFANR